MLPHHLNVKQSSVSLLPAYLSACFAADQCTCPVVTAPEEEQESTGICNALSQAKPAISSEEEIPKI